MPAQNAAEEGLQPRPGRARWPSQGGTIVPDIKALALLCLLAIGHLCHTCWNGNRGRGVDVGQGGVASCDDQRNSNWGLPKISTNFLGSQMFGRSLPLLSSIMNFRLWSLGLTAEPPPKHQLGQPAPVPSRASSGPEAVSCGDNWL